MRRWSLALPIVVFLVACGSPAAPDRASAPAPQASPAATAQAQQVAAPAPGGALPGGDQVVRIGDPPVPMRARSNGDQTFALGVSAVQNGTFVDRSGTIATAGTSQQVAAANAARNYLMFQNVSTGDLWLNFGTAATAASPSIRVQANQQLVWDTFVPVGAVFVLGGTAGAGYTAKEL